MSVNAVSKPLLDILFQMMYKTNRTMITIAMPATTMRAIGTNLPSSSETTVLTVEELYAKTQTETHVCVLQH